MTASTASRDAKEVTVPEKEKKRPEPDDWRRFHGGAMPSIRPTRNPHESHPTAPTRLRYGVNFESLTLTDAADPASVAALTAESASAVARPPHREVNPSCARRSGTPS
jgi:hypothetical protein